MDIIGRTNPPLANWSVQKTLDDMDKGAARRASLALLPQLPHQNKSSIGAHAHRELA
jgi:hypothetical protein